MGNITQFENPDATKGLSIPTQGAEAFGQAGYHEARVAHQIASDVQQTLGNFEEHEAMDQLTAHNNKLQAFEETINGDGPGSWNEAKAKGENANDFIKNTFQPGLDALNEGVTNKRARFAAIQTRNAVSISYHNKLLSEQNQIDGDNAVSSAEQTRHDGMNNVLMDPARLDADLQADTAKIDGIPYLANKPPGERAKLRQSIATDYATSAGEGWMRRVESPTATPEQIDQVEKIISDPNGTIFKFAPTSAMNTWLQRIDRAKGNSENTQAEINALAFKDGLTHVEQFGDGDKKVQSIVDAMPIRTSEQQVKKAAMQRELDEANGVFGVLDTSKNLSGADMVTKLNSLSDQYKAAGLDQQGKINDEMTVLSNYEKQRQQAFRQAPADFVSATTPSIANAWDTFQKAAPAQKAAAFQVAAAATQAEENRLYPGVSRDVLPQAIKTQVAQDLSVINSTPNGGVQASVTLGNLRNVAGPYWNQAVHELYHDKILLPGQYVAGAMMDNPDAASLSSEALRATSMPKGDLDKVSTLTEMQANKLAREAFSDLADTFQGSSTEEVAAYQTTLAAMLRARSTGSHTLTSDDASYLAHRMVLNAYNLQGGLRIPTSYDADSVVTGAKSVLSDIGNHDLVLPPGLHGPMVQKDQYTRDLQNYGKWTTNQAGDGAILLDQQNVPVLERTAHGSVPVEIDFNAFQKLGRAAAKATPSASAEFNSFPLATSR